MINILAGTVAKGPFKGRYCFKILPTWYAEYTRNGTVLEKGRFCSNDEDIIYDPDLGKLHKTLYAIEIQGPGKVIVAQTDKPVINKKSFFRFYRVKDASIS